MNSTAFQQPDKQFVPADAASRQLFTCEFEMRSTNSHMTGNISKILFFLSIFIFYATTICIGGDEVKDRSKLPHITGHSSSQTIGRYGLFINGANYIKIRAIDIQTKKRLNLIIDNTDFSLFMARNHGLKMDQFGRAINNEAYLKFRETEYIDYMIMHENKMIKISFKDLQKLVSQIHFGKEDLPDTSLKNYILIFENPMTFEQLGVKTENELIQTYFDYDLDGAFGKLKINYQKGYSLNPSFIATLLDLGFIVGQTDLVPLLFISR